MEAPSDQHLIEVGEDRLVDIIARYLEHRQGALAGQGGLVLEIGDDAMVWTAGKGPTIASTDQLLEGVDFLLPLATWEDIGWRSLAVNLSDIAAMGGRPLYALVSLALLPTTTVRDVLCFYQGMLDLARKTGVLLVGGDTGRSLSGAIIGVTVLGEGVGDRSLLLRRDAAAPGDAVAVTGELGLAAAGLLQLQGRVALPSVIAARAVQAHLRPEPRLLEGQILVQRGVRAGMDISDGLLKDLDRMCRASGVAARVKADLVPVPAALRASHADEALCWATTGGEDFELLVTLSPALVPIVLEALASHGAGQLQVVGEVIEHRVGEPRVALVDSAGRQVAMAREGYDHFSASAREA